MLKMSRSKTGASVKVKSRRSSARRRVRLAASIGAICVALTPVMAATPAHASVPPSKCGAFAVLISARGVNAPGGSNLQDGRTWLAGGMGDQLQGLVTSMQLDTQISVWTESLAWDANLGNSVLNYDSKVNAGASMLVTEIKSIVDGCRGQNYTIPNIFLAGHSGGADVVARALATLSGSGYQSYVDGAITYGDPSTSFVQDWNAPQFTQSAGLFARSDSQTDKIKAIDYYGWSYDSPQIRQPYYWPRVRAYCNNSDWACRGTVFGGWSNAAHNNYSQYNGDAKNFLKFLVTSTS